MIPGIAAPWMLPWLAAAVMPLLLALVAVRRPRTVPFGPIDLLLTAARRAHVTRAGIAWPHTLLRCLLVAAAATAATRPFLAGAGSRPPAAGTVRLVAGDADRRIVVVGGQPPGADPRNDATLALRLALEAVISASPRDVNAGGAGEPPSLDMVPLGAVATAGPRPPRGRELVILADGVVPGPGDAARIVAAVEAGGALLVCLGPESLADAVRPRLAAWLEVLGTGVAGIARLDDAAITIAADLAASPAPPRAAAAVDAAGFRLLPGPSVDAAAVLRLTGGDVLARTAPGDVPLLWTTRRGAGRVCLAAIPLALATREPADADTRDADRAWSDVAAWPTFVPLVDGLVERIAPGLLAARPRPTRTFAPPGPAAGFRVPLAPALLAFAILLAVADWLLAATDTAAAGTAAVWLRRCGRPAIMTTLLGMFVAWSGGLPPPTPPPAASRPVACVIDVSPSMAGPLATARTPGANEPGVTRLDAARDALLAGSPGMLARLARDRGVSLVTAADRVGGVAVGAAESIAGLRRLAATPAAPRASRLGDAVTDVLERAADGAHAAGAAEADRSGAAIVVVSDGVITAGASWNQAARAAAARRVPLVAVPVDDRLAATAGEGAGAHRGEGLPPGFRLTAVTPPRLCRVDEAIEIGLEAEAAGGTGPVPVRLWGSLPATGPPLAESTLDWQPRGRVEPPRLAGRLVVPPRTLAMSGTRYRSAVIVVGTAADGLAAAADGDAVVTTVPLAITDAALAVLFVESSPRFEWRFLERLLAADAAFAPRTWLASAAAASALPRRAERLPQDRPAWHRHDVVVLGDVPLGPAPTEAAAADSAGDPSPVVKAIAGLREAASSDAVGIAWLPGRRWQEDASGSPDWLPARIGPGGELPASVPRRLVAAGGGRAAIWLPPSRDTGPGGPDVFALRGPLILGPTARVLATAPPDAARPTAGGPPAVVLDRLGAAHVLAIFCETWRWRQADAAAWRSFWRHALARLGEPHLLARLFPATIDVQPAAITTGDVVRITITPTRATTDLAGWSLAVAPPVAADPSAARAAERATDQPASASVERTIGRADATGPGGAAVIEIAGLPAGVHTLLLRAPGTASPPEPATAAAEEGAASSRSTAVVSHTLVVSTPPVERPGAAAAATAFEAAALASGGAVVPLDRLDTLPEVLASLLDRPPGLGPDGDVRPPRKTADQESAARGLSSPQAARPRDQLLLLALLAAAAAAWWPAPSRPHGPEAADAGT